jgi:hypothetical protein
MILAGCHSVALTRSVSCSQKLYALCDIGIVITKELGKKKHFSGEYPGTIPLPAAFYKPIEAAEGQEAPAPKVYDVLLGGRKTFIKKNLVPQLGTFWILLAVV